MVSNINTAVTGLIVGTEYYLSTTPGAVVASPGPVTAGNISQFLGIASATDKLPFMNVNYVEIG